MQENKTQSRAGWDVWGLQRQQTEHGASHALRTWTCSISPLSSTCFLTHWMGNAYAQVTIFHCGLSQRWHWPGGYGHLSLHLSKTQPLERWWLWTSTTGSKKLLKNFEQESDIHIYTLMAVCKEWIWDEQRSKSQEISPGVGGKEGRKGQSRES